MSASESSDDEAPVTAIELAKRYPHALFFWSWHGTVVGGRTVLSPAKDHSEEMSSFFSTTSALEANLRVMGCDVKELSPSELCEQYARMEKEIAEILKSTGAVELNPDDIPANAMLNQRFTISDYKLFNTKTSEGLSSALDHMGLHGPLVGVYPVTEYQKMHEDSSGIIHGGEEANDQVGGNTPTRAICITGFGVEDLCSFFQFQKYNRAQDGTEKFGRLLASSLLELVGLFVEEAPVRCSKKQKCET